MEYMDEKILESRKEIERQYHTTLETGIYVDDKLITFSRVTLPDSHIQIFLPNQFIVMPDKVKAMKYPSKEAPDLIVTSLDGSVNLCFNILPVTLAAGDTKEMGTQFQTALKNVNPSIKIEEQTETVTEGGNEISWFEFVGYTLDGQSYNRMYIVRMRNTVLHGVFNCPLKDMNQWGDIVEKCFASIEEGYEVKGG